MPDRPTSWRVRILYFIAWVAGLRGLMASVAIVGQAEGYADAIPWAIGWIAAAALFAFLAYRADENASR